MMSVAQKIKETDNTSSTHSIDSSRYSRKRQFKIDIVTLDNCFKKRNSSKNKGYNSTETTTSVSVAKTTISNDTFMDNDKQSLSTEAGSRGEISYEKSDSTAAGDINATTCFIDTSHCPFALQQELKRGRGLNAHNPVGNELDESTCHVLEEVPYDIASHHDSHCFVLSESEPSSTLGSELLDAVLSPLQNNAMNTSDSNPRIESSKEKFQEITTNNLEVYCENRESSVGGIPPQKVLAPHPVKVATLSLKQLCRLPYINFIAHNRADPCSSTMPFPDKFASASGGKLLSYREMRKLVNSHIHRHMQFTDDDSSRNNLIMSSVSYCPVTNLFQEGICGMSSINPSS